jgi:hypothetical protein
MSKEPIKAGDLAEVISGIQGTASPNIGLIVSVVSLQGEHSQYGRIWRCEAEYGVLGQPGVDVFPGHMDCAQDWLRKINPPPLPDKVQTKDLVLDRGDL